MSVNAFNKHMTSTFVIPVNLFFIFFFTHILNFNSDGIDLKRVNAINSDKVLSQQCNSRDIGNEFRKNSKIFQESVSFL